MPSLLSATILHVIFASLPPTTFLLLIVFLQPEDLLPPLSVTVLHLSDEQAPAVVSYVSPSSGEPCTSYGSVSVEPR